MLVRGIGDFVVEFVYMYGAHSDSIVLKLADEGKLQARYCFRWAMADLLELTSRAGEEVTVTDLLQGTHMIWNGKSDTFQIVRREDKLDLSFGRHLPIIRGWLAAAMKNMLNRDIVQGQIFAQIDMPDFHEYWWGGEDYQSQRSGSRWIR